MQIVDGYGRRDCLDGERSQTDGGTVWTARWVGLYRGKLGAEVVVALFWDGVIDLI